MKKALFILILLLVVTQVDSFALDLKLVTTMDVGRSAQATVYQVKPKDTQELQEAVKIATQKNLKITMKGTNHSQGGQNYLKESAPGKPSAIQIDMSNFNQVISFDPESQLVTVQPGIRWHELKIFLGRHNFTNITQQASDIFSVGGSASTNIHGRDVDGPFMDSVHSLKIINSQGEEILVDWVHHPELLRAIIGGYGAFGIISEITLKVMPNYYYQLSRLENRTIHQYVDFVKAVLRGTPKKSLLHFARLDWENAKVDQATWHRIGTEAGQGLPPETEKFGTVASYLVNIMRFKPTEFLGRKLKWWLDSWFGLPKNGTILDRTSITSPQIEFLFDHFFNKSKSVDILQEYFIPPEQLAPFVEKLKSITEAHQVNVMNVTLRYVPKAPEDTNGLLSPYSTTTDLIAAVLYINIHESPKSKDHSLLVDYDGSEWTQKLIDAAIEAGGSFYLPYHTWWRADQFVKVYGRHLPEFINAKNSFDSQDRFTSTFWKKVSDIYNRNFSQGP